MKAFVVMAVYNRKKYTLQCLNLLKNQTCTGFGVVLVDDGSTDGTSEEVARYFPDVIVVKGPGDWWWTRSMIEGCEKAMGLGADVLISLNNDTLFNTRFIGDLLELHRLNPEAMIGCLNIVRKNRDYIFFSGIKDIIWWKAKEVKYHKAFTPLVEKLTGVHPTKCLNGRGTLIPVSIYDSIQGYDPQFPQYASDYDLALCAQEAGYACLISYDIRVRSFIEETGEGKSFMKQATGSFLRSFKNPHSQTSLEMWYLYYKAHAPKPVFLLGFAMQLLRMVFAFYKKRNLLERL